MPTLGADSWRMGGLLSPPCVPRGEARGLWCQPGAVCPCLQQAGENPPSSQAPSSQLSLLCPHGLSMWCVGTAMPSAMACVALVSPHELGCHWLCPVVAQMCSFGLIAVALTHKTPLALASLRSCCTLWNAGFCQNIHGFILKRSVEKQS